MFATRKALLCLFSLLLLGPLQGVLAQNRVKVGKPSSAKPSYGSLPLHFEENRGQTDSRVQYLARGGAYTIFLTPTEAVLALRSGRAESGTPTKKKSDRFRRPNRDGGQKISVLRMKLAGANASPVALPAEKLPGTVNYFLGHDPRKWRTGLPTYSKVQYLDVYSGIDLVYHSSQNQLEYDFVVNPGADARKIAFSFEGASAVALAASGDMNLDSPSGRLTAHKPQIYQLENGQRKQVSGNFVLRDAHTIGVDVNHYDRAKPLVIDPVLTFASYLGGSSDDVASSVAVDSQGYSYITGLTGSADFPISGTSVSAAPNGNSIGFVSKLDPTGSTLIYSTYLGGTTYDSPNGIAVDANGQAYVSGQTSSADFPVTANAYQTTYGSGASFNAFLSKLSSDGQFLLYSTLLGGSVNDVGTHVAIDASQNAFITGYASSPTFPVTVANAFQASLNSTNGNAFVTRIDTTKSGASSLVYSTFLGGSSPFSVNDLNSGDFGGDGALDIAVDSNENAYVVGEASSVDFPITAAKAYQTTGNANNSVFLTRLDTNQSGANSLIYSTFLGGTGTSGDLGFGIALDSSANAYITGCAFSSDFPVSIAGTNSAIGKAFVAKLNTNLSGAASFNYSTFLGGSAGDCGVTLAVDPDGNAYVGGYTFSSDFPITANAIQSTLQGNGTANGFIATLSPDGATLLYGTYLGGSGTSLGSYVLGLTLDSHQDLYIAGATGSTDLPTTPGAVQTAANGPSDGFVAQISGIVSTPQISFVSPSSGGIGAAVTLSGSAFGSTQGQSTVSFNGVSAPITNWNQGTITARVPSGLSAGTATVMVNGNSGSSNGVSFNVTAPLFATPNQATMLVGDTRPVQLLDENGAILSNVTWTFDNSSIAEILPPANPGDATLLQADAAGTTNFTATFGNRTGTGKLTVLTAGSTFPIGTIQWSTPSLGGGSISNSVQALRIDDNTPDLYAEDDGAQGGFGAIRALTADGLQKWIWPTSASASNPFPLLLAADDQGGAIYQAFSNTDSSVYLGRVDQTGLESWRYPLGTSGDLPYAIHPDGTIFIVDEVQDASQNVTDVVTAVDPATGQAKFSIPIPATYQVQYIDSAPSIYPNNCRGPRCCVPGASDLSTQQGKHGPLTVSSDGAVYLPIFGQSSVLTADACLQDQNPLQNIPLPSVNQTASSWSDASTLSVMVIQSDGTYSMQSLDSKSGSGTNWALPGHYDPLRGHAVPDGQGGVLVTQGLIEEIDQSTGQPIPQSLPFAATLFHSTSSGTSSFPLPNDVAVREADDDPLLLGEDGTAYIKLQNPAGNSLIAMATAGQSAGQVKWAAATGRSPRLSAVLADGSIVFQSQQSDNAMHLSIADPNGNVAPLFASPTDGSDLGPVVPNPSPFNPDFFELNNASYWTLGAWHAPTLDGMVAVTGNNLFVAASERHTARGSEQHANAVGFPQIHTYVPSQVESFASSGTATCPTLDQPQLTTNLFACWMDSQVGNAARRYPLPNTRPLPTGGNVVNQSYRIRQAATVQSFRKDLDGPLDALAFIGHSDIFSPPGLQSFSIGVYFYYPVGGTNPGDQSSWDVTYTKDGFPAYTLPSECAAPRNLCTYQPPDLPPAPINKLLPLEKDFHSVIGLSAAWNYGNSLVTFASTPPYPGPDHSSALLIRDRTLAEQAKILFFGSCALNPPFAQPNEVPVFLQMWDVNDVKFGVPEKRPRAIILPTGNLPETDLSYASAMWESILYDLAVTKLTVQQAVDKANREITPNWPNQSEAPPFAVYGNHTIKLKN